MARRRVASEKHLRAAYLLICEGLSGREALTKAGFSKWTARNFGRLYQRSAPLREAIRMMQEQTSWKAPALPPKRCRRQDRRVIRAIDWPGAEPPSRFEDRERLEEVHRKHALDQQAATVGQDRCNRCGDWFRRDQLVWDVIVEQDAIGWVCRSCQV